MLIWRCSCSMLEVEERAEDRQGQVEMVRMMDGDIDEEEKEKEEEGGDTVIVPSHQFIGIR